MVYDWVWVKVLVYDQRRRIREKKGKKQWRKKKKKTSLGKRQWMWPKWFPQVLVEIDMKIQNENPQMILMKMQNGSSDSHFYS